MRKAITLLLGMSLLLAAPVAGQSNPPRGQHGMHQVPDSVSGTRWYPGMGWYGGMLGMGYGGMMGPGRMGLYPDAQGIMSGARMGMMMAYDLPSPGVILRMRDQLGLTDAQVSQLESLQTNVQETLRADLTSAREARENVASILESQSPDLKAYQQRLQEVATDEVDAQVALANASVEARGVLTPEQLQKVQDGISMLQGMYESRPFGLRRGQGTMGGNWNRLP